MASPGLRFPQYFWEGENYLLAENFTRQEVTLDYARGVTVPGRGMAVRVGNRHSPTDDVTFSFLGNLGTHKALIQGCAVNSARAVLEEDWLTVEVVSAAPHFTTRKEQWEWWRVILTMVDGATLPPSENQSETYYPVPWNAATCNTPLPLSGMAQGAQVDVVYVFDTSGSMGPYRDSVVASLGSLSSRLVLEGIDYQIGLLEFGQNGPVEHSIGGHQFSSVDNEVKLALNNLQIQGGLEPGGEALQYMIDNYNFRPNSVKHVIFVTDEPFQRGGTIKSSATIAAVLAGDGFTVHVIAKPGETTLEPLATETGGIYADIEGSYGTIFDQISQNVVTQIQTGGVNAATCVNFYASDCTGWNAATCRGEVVPAEPLASACKYYYASDCEGGIPVTLPVDPSTLPGGVDPALNLTIRIS